MCVCVCVCGGVQKQSMSMRATTRESDGPPTGPPLITGERAALLCAREVPESAVLAQSMPSRVQDHAVDCPLAVRPAS